MSFQSSSSIFKTHSGGYDFFKSMKKDLGSVLGKSGKKKPVSKKKKPASALKKKKPASALKKKKPASALKKKKPASALKKKKPASALKKKKPASALKKKKPASALKKKKPASALKKKKPASALKKKKPASALNKKKPASALKKKKGGKRMSGGAKCDETAIAWCSDRSQREGEMEKCKKEHKKECDGTGVAAAAAGGRSVASALKKKKPVKKGGGTYPLRYFTGGGTYPLRYFMGGGSDFGFTNGSSGNINAPDGDWAGVGQGETHFRQFNTTGDYIPTSDMNRAFVLEDGILGYKLAGGKK